jgi:glycosyltransferase involved in cell wall biosynthesis/SAM-dependent methyltransferase
MIGDERIESHTIEPLAQTDKPNSSASRKIKVLHVEVGGAYGGSLRSLEVYLAYSDASRLVHDVLFYYPTPGMEKLKGRAQRIITLYDSVPEAIASPPVMRMGGFKERLKNSRFAPELMDLRDSVRLFLSRGAVNKIAKLLREQDYHVMHVNNTFTYQERTLLAARKVKVPLIAHVRNPVPRRRFNEMLLRWPDQVVTVSRVLEKELRSWGSTTSICTCHDPVEPPVADSAVAAALRASLLPKGGILVGSVGRLDPQKGYHDLIRAARRVVDCCLEAHFAIAGEGPLRPSLEASIAELGLKDRFHLCGFRTDIANFIAALDLFVCSSHWEGLALAIAEAMLLGKPVVSTDAGGNSDIVVPGETGRLVPCRDPVALADAILAALNERETTARLAAGALSKARTLTDPISNARAFDNLVEEAAARSDFRTRCFYEEAYTTEAWRRPQANDRGAPGARFSKMWYRSLLDHFVPQIDLQGKQVLEVGCGNGYLVPYLCPSVAKFVGVDLALNAVRQLPRVNGEKCYAVVADGKHLPFLDDSFDLLICLEVLEHVGDPEHLLDECFRVVHRPGYLIFSCPNYCNLFILPKLLANLGVPAFRRYMRHQVIDRMTTAFSLRRLLTRRGTLLSQRGVRLQPPLFEQLDYRLPPGNPLRRINDWIFAIENKWGNRPPLNYLGLHTVCLVKVDRPGE